MYISTIGKTHFDDDDDDDDVDDTLFQWGAELQPRFTLPYGPIYESYNMTN